MLREPCIYLCYNCDHIFDGVELVDCEDPNCRCGKCPNCGSRNLEGTPSHPEES